jgi:hypothetical protein
MNGKIIKFKFTGSDSESLDFPLVPFSFEPLVVFSLAFVAFRNN